MKFVIHVLVNEMYLYLPKKIIMKLEEQLQGLGVIYQTLTDMGFEIHDHFSLKIITNLFTFCYLIYDC